MKAISLWQPWASLWVAGPKMHETRHWSTKHRGWLLVHAAKRIERDLDQQLLSLVVRLYGQNWARILPTGALLGSVKLWNCKLTEKTIPVDHDDRICGNWDPGRYAWRAVEFISWDVPIPFRGRQGLFEVPMVRRNDSS